MACGAAQVPNAAQLQAQIQEALARERELHAARRRISSSAAAAAGSASPERSPRDPAGGAARAARPGGAAQAGASRPATGRPTVVEVRPFGA
jgi:hypothetical protein